MDHPVPLELFGFQTGNCLRASIALEEAEIPYRARVVDLRRLEHRSNEFIRLNPAGQVPVLVNSSKDDGFVLSQSNAIIFYAADKAPAKLLGANDARARSLAYERFFFFLTDVIAFSHTSSLVAGSVETRTYRDLQDRVMSAMAFSERFVRDAPYMAGDEFTIADIAGMTIAHALASRLDWDHLPHLKRWFVQVSRRASVVRAFKAFAAAHQD